MPCQKLFLFTAIFAVMIYSNCCAQNSFAPAIELKVGGGGGKGVPAVMGWEFEAVADGTITALGVFDQTGMGQVGAGLPRATPIGVWNSDGELLVSAKVPKGVAGKLFGNFRYVPIEPLQLKIGKTYVIGSAHGAPRGNEMPFGVGRFYSDGAIRWMSSRSKTAVEELVFPESQTANESFSANFILSESTTPRIYYFPHLMENSNRVLIPRKESQDLSHLRDHVVLISLFSRKNGELTQVALNGEPIGNDASTIEELNSRVPQLIRNTYKETKVRPNLRIATSPWGRMEHLWAVLDAGSGNRQPPLSHKFGPATIELKQLHDGSIRHVEQNPPSRFVDHGLYLEDTWTGLYWQTDGMAVGEMNYYEAMEKSKEIKLKKLNNWRVPTVAELATIFPAEAPFTNSQYNPDRDGPGKHVSYWTSEMDPSGPDYAFLYQWFAGGGPNNCYASKNKAFVRFVHDPLGDRNRRKR